MAYLLYFLLVCGMVYSVPLTEKEQCGYVGCPKTDPNVLNVHIVPHTHDDVGWLKTVDQYYYGSRNNIQKAGVQYIIDSVVSELWEDPRRKFIYVETAFFWKWWVRQSIEKQSRVQRLVREGRLQFVGGAWSMNDEAAAHYHSTVDQFTWGLSKINETFGPCALPKVGWQIDPFGHSREFASLLAAMGYDGLFLGRIDYQDKRARLRDRTMEMVWRGDDDLGSASDIFTGVLYNTYSPPPGFCFDVLCSDEPIVDDPDSPMFNVDQKIDLFLSYVMNQAKSYTTNNVLITMGGDFTYQDARMWYTNLDKLIGYTNLKAGKDQLNIKLYYSTPNCYLKSVKESNPILPMKTDDFFPYASDPNSYWTGYFTSRPTTKYFERQGNMFLQMVKQLQVLADLEKHNIFVLNQLKSAMGVMQHHDAITGTEKQHVTRDYERILSQAVQDAAFIARQAFSKTIGGEAAALYRYDICRLNESSCDASENSRHFQVTLYNPLAWDVDHPVRIPVVDGVYEVYAPNSDKIDSQLLEIPQQILNLPNRVSKATHELNFIAYLHPLMIKSFYVKKVDSQRQERMTNRKNGRFHRSSYHTTDYENKGPVLDRFERESENAIPTNSNKSFKKGNVNFDEHVNELVRMIKDIRDSTHRQGKSEDVFYRQNVDNLRMLSDDPSVIERLEDFFSISNDKMQIIFDNASGEIKSIRNPNRSTNLTIGFYYYPGYVGNNGEPANRSSGAYIFRPSTIHPIQIDRTDYKVVTGKVVKQMSMSFEHNVHVSMRLYDAIDYLEIDYIVGPIDVEDGVGKEYIIKYGTDIINNGEFYTDSNGRQIIKRKLNYRPEFNVTLAEPVGGNYYPINNNIFIKNDIKIFSVATDRSQGGSSLAEGEIELMLHRRLLHDDAFGVDEALNETVNGKGLIVKGTHRLHLYSNNDQEQLKSVINMDIQPIIFVSEANNLELEDWLKTKNCFSWLKTPLPLGVHLLTLEPWNDHLLLRLENYLKKSDDSSKEIDLNTLFVNIKVNGYRETVLSGNQWLNKYEKWYWDTNTVDNVCKKRQSELKDEHFKIVLKAKQIRTFIIDYDIV